MFADDIEKAWQRFAYEANRWANRANAISPDSPDFERRVREQWQQRKIEQRFDALRKVMDGPSDTH